MPPLPLPLPLPPPLLPPSCLELLSFAVLSRDRNPPDAGDPMPETAILSICAAPPKPYSSSPRRPLVQPELVQQLPPPRRLLVEDVRHRLHQHAAAAQLQVADAIIWKV